MSRLREWIAWLYGRTLSLYPPAFRAEFGEEMQGVFLERLRVGETPAVILILRELRDLPANLLAQYSSAFNEERSNMSALNHADNQKPGPGKWIEVFLAGLPHLVMWLLIGGGKLLGPEAAGIITPAAPWIGGGLATVVLIVMLAGRRTGWPLWSASWYLYAAWIVLAVTVLGVQQLGREDDWRITNALFLGWLLLFILVFFRLLTRSRLHALLSLTPLFPLLGFMFLEFVPNPIEGWAAVGIGVLVALTAAAIVRTGDFRLGLGFVAGLHLVSGTALAYIGHYRATDHPYESITYEPSFENFLLTLAAFILIPLAAFGIPILVSRFWNRERDRRTLAP